MLLCDYVAIECGWLIVHRAHQGHIQLLPLMISLFSLCGSASDPVRTGEWDRSQLQCGSSGSLSVSEVSYPFVRPHLSLYPYVSICVSICVSVCVPEVSEV